MKSGGMSLFSSESSFTLAEVGSKTRILIECMSTELCVAPRSRWVDILVVLMTCGRAL